MAKHEDIRWDYWVGDYWSERRAVEPWQACALSLHIEPNSMTADHRDYSNGPFVKGMWEPEKKLGTLVEFERRLDLLYQDKDDPRFFTPRSDEKLLLYEVVAWMKKKGILDFPWELAKLDAKPEELAEREKAKTELDASELDASKRFADRHFPTAPDPSTTPLTPASAESGQPIFDIDPQNEISPTHRRKKGDWLSPLIKEAVETVGSETADVWALLLEWASLQQPKRPLRRVDAGKLIFENYDGEDQAVTRKNITDRIYRRIRAQTIAANKTPKKPWGRPKSRAKSP